MKWGRLIEPRVLAADIGLALWFLSRLYSVGLLGNEPFNMTTPTGEIAAGPRVETEATLSTTEPEGVDTDRHAPDGTERETEVPPEDFLQDPMVYNPDEVVIGGETQEMIEPPPPPDEGEVRPENDQAGMEPTPEIPPEEFLQDPMANNPDEGVIGGYTGEVFEPPPPPDEGEFRPESDQAGAGPTPEIPPEEFLQDPMANPPDEGMIGGETGEMFEPPPSPDQGDILAP